MSAPLTCIGEGEAQKQVQPQRVLNALAQVADLDNVTFGQLGEQLVQVVIDVAP